MLNMTGAIQMHTADMDEIGDITMDLQPKILRVLQEQEFERLGFGGLCCWADSRGGRS
jgi:transcriptional regulator of acetoin/glycerol metabolism